MTGSSSQSPSNPASPPLITLRALVLGALTIAAMFYYIVQVGQGRGWGSFIYSQYSMAAFMPFVLWLFLNCLLKRLWPGLALRRGEILTIFAMTWVVSSMPQKGWMNYWPTSLATPGYFLTPDGPWYETIHALLPWHVFPDSSPQVIDTFWHGLPEGMSIPWDGWVIPFIQWLSVSLGMVLFGFCLIALFQHQWAEVEKLPFPLAQMPMDLTQGFDGCRRMPDLFHAPLFWLGFGTVFLPMLYNVATYFTPGLQTVEIFVRYNLAIGEHLPQGIWFRIVPLGLAVIYLCPLNILGSLLVFYWLTVPKEWVMRRTGFTIGSEGQQIDAWEILYMESYGALVFVGLWSIWLARRHLWGIWHMVYSGQGDPRQVAHYRLILAGLVLSAAYVVGWLMTIGMSLPLAVGMFLLIAIVYLVTVKLIAATGFAYLFPNWAHLKGGSFIVDLVGTANLSPRSLVAYRLFDSNLFFGTFRLLAWPAITHILRIFSLRNQPRCVVALVFVAFPVGFLVAGGATIELAYESGGFNVLGGGSGIVDSIGRLLSNPTVPNAGKWAVWLFGFFEAAGVAFLRARFHWFPLHPIGPVFQYTYGVWLYWSGLFIVWLVKFTLLHYGGIRAYLAGKPFFYGLAIGYVIGVMLSSVVDLIWFPTEGHRVHAW